MSAESIVFVVDDDDFQRRMLCDLLESVRLKVEDFASAQAFLARGKPEGPACLIVDLRMPEMDGLELLQTLRARLDSFPAIMLSAYGEIPTVVRSMQLGAVDFLTKPVNHQHLLEVVRKALAADQHQRDQFGDPRLLAQRLETLTPREREVLEGIIQGKANKAIAYELGTSVRTVETHRANLMRKLEVRVVADLVRMVLPLRRT